MGLLLRVVERTSVGVGEVPEVSVFLSVVRCVIEQRCAVVDLLGEPSHMDITVAKLVKRELVVDIGFDEGVGIEVEARHSDEYFKHRDVILLDLHLQTRKSHSAPTAPSVISSVEIVNIPTL